MKNKRTFRLSLNCTDISFFHNHCFLYLYLSSFHSLLSFVVVICLFFVLFWWVFNFFFSYEKISFNLRVIQCTALNTMIKSSNEVNKFWNEMMLLTLSAAEIDRKNDIRLENSNWPICSEYSISFCVCACFRSHVRFYFRLRMLILVSSQGVGCFFFVLVVYPALNCVVWVCMLTVLLTEPCGGSCRIMFLLSLRNMYRIY